MIITLNINIDFNDLYLIYCLLFLDFHGWTKPISQPSYFYFQMI